MEIEKMEFNMFKLKIHVGSSEKDYDLYILANEDVYKINRKWTFKGKLYTIMVKWMENLEAGKSKSL